MSIKGKAPCHVDRDASLEMPKVSSCLQGVVEVSHASAEHAHWYAREQMIAGANSASTDGIHTQEKRCTFTLCPK
jgi:hypothetical protein